MHGNINYIEAKCALYISFLTIGNTNGERTEKNALLTSKDLKVLCHLYIGTTYSAPETQPWIKCSKKHL